MNSAKEIASQMAAEIRALPVQNTPNRRAIRRKYSKLLKDAEADYVLAVARELRETYDLLHPKGYLYLIQRGAYGVKTPDYSRMA